MHGRRQRSVTDTIARVRVHDLEPHEACDSRRLFLQQRELPMWNSDIWSLRYVAPDLNWVHDFDASAVLSSGKVVKL